MRHTDRIDYDRNDPNGPPGGTPHTPVNRGAPDAKDNRSIFQRFIHLTHDTNRARLCNKEGAVLDLGLVSYPLFGSYHECELFEIDNVAVFYMQAILGRAQMVFKDSLVDLVTVDSMTEALAGIPGFTRSPSPQAINRMVFAPRNAFLKALIDPPLAADGVPLEGRHPGTVFAWELLGLYDSMRPLLTAFDDHGRLDLFADLISVIHLHYSSPAADTTQAADPARPAFAHQSGLVRFEELMARAFVEGNGVNVAVDLLDAAATTTTVDGVRGRDVLLDLPRQLLLPEWNPGLTLRDGSTTLVENDGTTPVTELAPAWLLLDALRRARAAVASDPAALAKLDDALDHIAHQVLATEPTQGGTRFHDRRGYALVRALTSFARERLLAHWQAEDIGPWAASLERDAADLLDHPATAAAVDLGTALDGDAGARAAVEALLLYLVDADSPNRALDNVLAAGVDVAQVIDDRANVRPLLRALAPVLTPDQGVLAKGLVFLDHAQELDDTAVLPRLLAGLVKERASGETPVEALLDIASEVNRAAPGAGSALADGDFAAIFATVADFFTDETRGLERLYALVENR